MCFVPCAPLYVPCALIYVPGALVVCGKKFLAKLGVLAVLKQRSFVTVVPRDVSRKAQCFGVLTKLGAFCCISQNCSVSTVLFCIFIMYNALNTWGVELTDGGSNFV